MMVACWASAWYNRLWGVCQYRENSLLSCFCTHRVVAPLHYPDFTTHATFRLNYEGSLARTASMKTRSHNRDL